LSKEEICLFLKNICEKENVALSSAMIAKIQTMFFSDIRSMINYIQSNQFFLQQSQAHNTFVDDTVWEKGYQELKESHQTTFIEQVFIDNETNPHSDTKSLIKQFLLFLIRKEIHQEEKDEEKDEEKPLIKILSMSSTLMHHPFINTATQIGFLISKLAGLY
jgi:hypothetical protein